MNLEQDATVKKQTTYRQKEKMNHTFSLFLQNFVVRPGDIAKPNIEVKCVKIRRI